MTVGEARERMIRALEQVEALTPFFDPRLDELRRLRLAQLEAFVDSFSTRDPDDLLPEQGFNGRLSVLKKLTAAFKLLDPPSLRQSASWLASSRYREHLEAVELVVGRRPKELVIFVLEDGEGLDAAWYDGLALYVPRRELEGEGLVHSLVHELVHSTQEAVFTELSRLESIQDGERVEATRILVEGATEHICLACGASVDGEHAAEMATLETVSVQLESPVLELALEICHCERPLDVVSGRVELDEPELVEGVLDLFAEYASRIAPLRDSV